MVQLLQQTGGQLDFEYLSTLSVDALAEYGGELTFRDIDRAMPSVESYEVPFEKLEETEEKWLKDLIGKYIPAFDKILELQKLIKIPFTVTEKDKFIEGILRGRTFRVRYTILQYLYDRGELEKYADYAYEETMKYQ